LKFLKRFDVILARDFELKEMDTAQPYKVSYGTFCLDSLK